MPVGSSLNVAAGHDMAFWTEPYAAGAAMPADTVAWGTTPGGSFALKGYTNDGFTIGMQHQFQDITVDQQVDPLYSIPQSREFTLETNLAEVTAANFADASGQGAVTSVAAISGTRGHDDVVWSGSIGMNYQTGLMDFLNPGDGEAIRFLFRRGQVRSQIQARFQVNPNARLNYRVQLYPDPNNSNIIAQYRDIQPALA